MIYFLVGILSVAVMALYLRLEEMKKVVDEVKGLQATFDARIDELDAEHYRLDANYNSLDARVVIMEGKVRPMG